MADTEEWFVGEDGSLSVGKPTHSVTYHSGLNTILVSTKEPSVNVIDVTSGSVLQKSDLSGTENDTASFHHNVVYDVICPILVLFRHEIIPRFQGDELLICKLYCNKVYVVFHVNAVLYGSNYIHIVSYLCNKDSLEMSMSQSVCLCLYVHHNVSSYVCTSHIS